jgi:hypothetical protein
MRVHVTRHEKVYTYSKLKIDNYFKQYLLLTSTTLTYCSDRPLYAFFRSGECNGRGRLECGACDCFQGYSGLMCECMGNTDNGDLNACKQVTQLIILQVK